MILIGNPTQQQPSKKYAGERGGKLQVVDKILKSLGLELQTSPHHHLWLSLNCS
jgi:hypothetical protein